MQKTEGTIAGKNLDVEQLETMTFQEGKSERTGQGKNKEEKAKRTKECSHN